MANSNDPARPLIPARLAAELPGGGVAAAAAEAAEGAQ